MSPIALRLFEAFGIELEYMIVDRQSLDVRPLADVCLQTLAGASEVVSDAELGPVTFSNELVAHVLELKTTDPAPALAPLPRQFETGVRQANQVLALHGACLMPSAMHPWMDPHTQTQLWPHDNREIYETFHRIFDCRGHGWSNLQSVHLNLPFSGDEEFARLHAAIRLILPILPALAASSPLLDGHRGDWLDMRMQMYRGNSQRIPQVAGRIVPEPVFSAAEYRRQIFEPMWAAVVPHDPEGVLQDEFLNARGAIGRFGRGTIEIRVLDVQECPLADVAICAAVVAVVEALVRERWAPLAAQQRWPVERLEPILWGCCKQADQFLLSDLHYLQMLGWQGASQATAGQLWSWLLDEVASQRADAELFAPVWRVLAEQGPLARRLLRALPAAEPVPLQALQELYGRMCDCLAEGQLFVGL